MKISVNDTQVVTKNVWISRIIIQEKPPHKKSMLVTQHFQPRCEDSLSQQKLNCQLNSLGAGDTPVQTFYPERETERESRLPKWNTNQQVDIEGFLHLHSPVLFLFTITSYLPFAFTWQPNSLFPLSHEIWLFCSLSPPLGDIQTLSELDSI